MNECKNDTTDPTSCLSGFAAYPNNLCTRQCAADADCPRPWTCQAVPIQGAGDAGVTTISVCLPTDALGKPCRNELGTDSNGPIDPVQDCTTMGDICFPTFMGQTQLPTGNCMQGDNCSFQMQTGCMANQTCHPAGIFGLDNNQGTICFNAASTGGTEGNTCMTSSACAKGYICGGQRLGCVKYCNPGMNPSGCEGITRPGADGGTVQTSCIQALSGPDGGPPPASIGSINVGVCL
jgi:hypothetical protein